MRRKTFPIISPKKRNLIIDTFCNEITLIWEKKKRNRRESISHILAEFSDWEKSH